jgi:hypothetical protein
LGRFDPSRRKKPLLDYRHYDTDDRIHFVDLGNRREPYSKKAARPSGRAVAIALDSDEEE